MIFGSLPNNLFLSSVIYFLIFYMRIIIWSLWVQLNVRYLSPPFCSVIFFFFCWYFYGFCKFRLLDSWLFLNFLAAIDKLIPCWSNRMLVSFPPCFFPCNNLIWFNLVLLLVFFFINSVSLAGTNSHLFLNFLCVIEKNEALLVQWNVRHPFILLSNLSLFNFAQKGVIFTNQSL